MPKYTAQRINFEGCMGKPVEFEAQADGSRPMDPGQRIQTPKPPIVKLMTA